MQRIRTSRTFWLSSYSALCLIGWTIFPKYARSQEAGLAYDWSVGQEFAYEIEITVDEPNALVTYKGITQYRVDGTNAEQLNATYRGGLTESKKPKEQSRPAGPPGFPGAPPGLGRPPGFGGPPGFPLGGPFPEPILRARRRQPIG